MLFGPMPTHADLHRRLVRARPAAVLHVDDRLPFPWLKDDGVYPTWVRRYGMPPTAALPFRVAWELRREGVTRARVHIRVRLRAAQSQNVVADIPGRDPKLPMLVLGAHHDTQCHSCGADDNASAVVALLELAPRLAAARLRRSVRLISFGAEEQLSLGSAVYARRHRAEMVRMGAVLNMDSVSSFLGHHWMIRAGTDRFGRWMVQALGQAGLDVLDKPAPMPFADHFPFSVFGVPAITLYRPNMDSGMRWQHHSQHDRLRNVSVPELERVVAAVEQVVLRLARQPGLPFPRGLAPGCRAETARLARDLFDLRMSA
jgi:Iap family predicted aminopeptidase